MLDRNYLLEHAKLVKENIAKRNKPDKVKLVDDFLRADTDWRKIKSQLDQLRHRRNILSQEINTAKKNNKNVVPLVAEAKGLPQKVADLEKNEQELVGKIHDLLMRIPNIMHPSVPGGADESKNPEVKKWGKIKKLDFELVSHAELAERLGFADFEAGRENTGKGFNYLIGELAQLDLALQRYGIDF
ncbi:serine--tRNA ligase, partial [Candidatus Woesearchaeota archaeon]|nr:serine--tRNA ligase [Candidatus Woesearchaeota archaeon]